MFKYFFLIDYIEAFFWTVTYMFIALVGFINKDDSRLAMPKISLFTNFAWEVASIIVLNDAFFSQGGYIRFAWFLFDVLILLTVLKKKYALKDLKIRSIFFFFSWFALMVFFVEGFKFGKLFMPISAFIIDAGMEVCFWFQRKKLDPSLRLVIGVSKILGDFFAGIYYGYYDYLIIPLAIVAFVFDVLYIIFAVKELKENPEINKTFKYNLQNSKLYLKPYLKKQNKKCVNQNNVNKRRKYKKKK